MKTRSSVLTKEERDMLVLAALNLSGKHLTNSEIGQRLGISVTRVKTLLHQACVKLGAHNRNEAIWSAMRRGEINITEFLSLGELAELLSSLDSDTLREIANLMRQKLEHRHLPEKAEQIIRVDRRQEGILTNRERDVLILAAHGLTNLEIANKLFISASAVRTFFNRASNKLGARKRTDAVLSALKQREISVGEITSLDETIQILAPFGAESLEKMAQLLDEKSGRGPTSTRS